MSVSGFAPQLDLQSVTRDNGATKITSNGKDYEGATKAIDESLMRLNMGQSGSSLAVPSADGLWLL
jgi:hypothetical protein